MLQGLWSFLNLFLKIFLLFLVQEELGRTISQLTHAFQTTEARKYTLLELSPFASVRVAEIQSHWTQIFVF